jgi:hypothetical protein
MAPAAVLGSRNPRHEGRLSGENDGKINGEEEKGAALGVVAHQ